VISKADTLTPDECHEFKREILREIELHKISIYQFPDGADDDEARANRKLRERIPFAVIGSNAVLSRRILNKIFEFFKKILKYIFVGRVEKCEYFFGFKIVYFSCGNQKRLESDFLAN